MTRYVVIKNAKTGDALAVQAIDDWDDRIEEYAVAGMGTVITEEISEAQYLTYKDFFRQP